MKKTRRTVTFASAEFSCSSDRNTSGDNMHLQRQKKQSASNVCIRSQTEHDRVVDDLAPFERAIRYLGSSPQDYLTWDLRAELRLQSTQKSKRKIVGRTPISHPASEKIGYLSPNLTSLALLSIPYYHRGPW